MSETPALHFYGRKPVTFDEAKDLEEDFVKIWEQDRALEKFYKRLFRKKEEIKALTRHHLRLDKEEIIILPTTDWLRGAFNLCIPLQVKNGRACREYMFRCPMPHKLAEAQYPGTVDEKMRCEVGAYVWMQENCSDVRIPYLYGFGFSGHRHFTHQGSGEGDDNRESDRIKTASSHNTIVSRYVAQPAEDINFPITYMLLEYISSDIGQMLSITWDRYNNDLSHKHKLFESISRITLSLAQLENEGSQRIIQVDQVYQSTEAFVSDTLKLHDNAFVNHPNSAYDDDDCYSQMAARASLREVSHHHISREQRNGPYFMQYTDLTRSNVFVDDDWNITCLLDLEWICALPVEMIRVPHWLSGCDYIDGLKGETHIKFSMVRQEFMEIFQKEEDKMSLEHTISLTDAINNGWASKSVWFWHTMNTSVITLYPIVKAYIYKSLSIGPDKLDDIERALSALWGDDRATIVAKKRADYNGYLRALAELIRKHGKPVAKV
ncbi:hypothetical protein GGI35DRAFT_466462 [Trichoderma velutinum]